MQGPLPASPGSPGMNPATVAIKDTVPVNNFHLDNITRYPQIFCGDLGQR